MIRMGARRCRGPLPGGGRGKARPVEEVNDYAGGMARVIAIFSREPAASANTSHIALAAGSRLNGLPARSLLLTLDALRRPRLLLRQRQALDGFLLALAEDDGID